MATAAAGAGDRSVSIGRIFSRAFGTIGSNPLTALALAFLFGGLPTTLLAYAIQNHSHQAPDLLGVLGATVVGLATPACTIAMAMITQGALVRTTIAHSEGGVAGFGESAAAGLAVAFPLFVMAVLSGAAIGLGLILLVVPGALLYVIWAVAGPALVEERLGPLEALRRSRGLTRRARWKVFALVLVASIGSWLAGGVMGLVNTDLLGGPESLLEPLPLGPPARLPLLFYSLNAVFQTLILAMWAVIQTSLYVELRDWTDGPSTEALADIFA